MGRKQKLIDGLEVDVLYARKQYCYLCNNNKIVKYAKHKMNKRLRKEMKDLDPEIIELVNQHFWELL